MRKPAGAALQLAGTCAHESLPALADQGLVPEKRNGCGSTVAP